MYIKSIHNYFLFNKGLKDYNRKQIKSLTKREINALYSVYLNDGVNSFVSFNKVVNTISFCGFSDLYRNTQNLLNDLVLSGDLVKQDGRMKYKLSVEGLNKIYSLEKRIRKERWNR